MRLSGVILALLLCPQASFANFEQAFLFWFQLRELKCESFFWPSVDHQGEPKHLLTRQMASGPMPDWEESSVLPLGVRARSRILMLNPGLVYRSPRILPIMTAFTRPSVGDQEPSEKFRNLRAVLRKNKIILI